MRKEEIMDLITEVAKEYGWNTAEALHHLAKIGFDLESVVGNSKFTKSHIMMSVDFAYSANMG